MVKFEYNMTIGCCAALCCAVEVLFIHHGWFAGTDTDALPRNFLFCLFLWVPRICRGY